MVSFWDLVLLIVLFLVVNSAIMFFVIKGAARSALSDDRMLQAKDAKARSEAN